MKNTSVYTTRLSRASAEREGGRGGERERARERERERERDSKKAIKNLINSKTLLFIIYFF